METHSFLYRSTFPPQAEKKEKEVGARIMNRFIVVLSIAALLWCVFMPPDQYLAFLIVSGLVLFVCNVLRPLASWVFNVRPPSNDFTFLFMAWFTAEICILMIIASARIHEEAKAVARQKAYEEAKAVARQKAYEEAKAADEAADDDLSQ